MDHEFPKVPSDMRVKELGDLIASRDPAYTKYHAFVVLDENSQLVGMVTHGDVLRALEQNRDERMTVLEAGAKEVIVTYPDEMLYDAAGKMLRANVGRLPVVSRQEPKQVLGYLNRAGVLSARLKRMHEETDIETGWMRTWRKNGSAKTI
jgi:CBS domain-containing protein